MKRIDGFKVPLQVRRVGDTDQFNFEAIGDVIGGIGSVTPSRLTFSALLVKRDWSYGFTSIQFDDRLCLQIDERGDMR